MPDQQAITLQKLPSLPPLLMKAAVSRRTPGANPVFPQNSLQVAGIRIEPAQLDRYAEACGFKTGQDYLPPSYLHILAFRLQMKLMLQADFPVSAMGCVHLKNTIHQYRPIARDEVIDLSCRIEYDEVTERGYEFSFLCQAFVESASGNRECVWEDHSLYLSRRKSSGKSAKPPRPPVKDYPNSQPIDIARTTARRYAKASGDFNPIHLHDISAKLLGFPKMIAHGMWSKAACIAALLNSDAPETFSCEVEFKIPVYLPARAMLCFDKTTDETLFELRDSRDRPHLSGRLVTK